MSKWITIATVPDVATAGLVREVLVEGGLEDVDVRSQAGVAYMARAVRIQFDVRVPPEDVQRAQLVLRDYEEEIGLAAIREANVEPPLVDEERPRSRSLLWLVAALTVAVLASRYLLFR